MKTFDSMVEVIGNAWRNLRSGRFGAEFPALLILLGIINAVLPPVLFPQWEWQRLLLSVLPLIIGGALLLPRRQLAVLLAAVGTGFAGFELHRRTTAGSYLALLNNRDCGAEIVAKVVDTSCCGKAVPWLSNPALLTVQVTQVRLTGENNWTETYGRTAVRLPRSAPVLDYGAVIRLEGTFRSPENYFLLQENIVSAAGKVQAKPLRRLPVPGSEPFANYLEARHISRIFYCRKFYAEGYRQAGWYRPILAIRNFLLQNVTAGIENRKCRDLLAALLFGCRQGLNYADKLNYIKSGTIHIFTVSGLHVGILALLLFWFFRWVPFRTRHLLVPGLVLLYVISTGMYPPALRAWLMIAVWCVCRAFLLYVPALNIVFLTAAALLVKNPFYLKDMGFQFSFTVVGFLIASGRNCRDWGRWCSELLSWIPVSHLSRRRYRFETGRRRLLLTLLGCVTAWLASSGICLYYQGIYFPFSVVANFLLIPCVLLLFNLVFLKLLLSIFGLLLPITAGLVEHTAGMIDFVAGFSLDLFAPTHAAAPTIFGLLLFYAALALLAVSRRGPGMIAGLLGTAGMIVFWHVSGDFTAPSLTVIHGGNSQETAWIIIEPPAKSALVINVPSYETAHCIAARLGQSGVRKIDTLVFSGNRKDCCSGTETLLRYVKVRQVVQLEPDSHSPSFDAALAAALSAGAAYETGQIDPDDPETRRYRSGKIEIITKNRNQDIDYHSSLLHIKAKLAADYCGCNTLELGFGGCRPIRSRLLNCSIPEMKDYLFNRTTK
ncbi:MAG: ComEC/Rec2 family competence protein [Victivallaceae bacterium]|nr:ComEC/Rec2 family competence protein [Victivallaceae bacterium]